MTQIVSEFMAGVVVEPSSLMADALSPLLSRVNDLTAGSSKFGSTRCDPTLTVDDLFDLVETFRYIAKKQERVALSNDEHWV